MPFMNNVAKATCIGIYLCALTGLLVDLPFGVTAIVQRVALIVIFVHFVELLVAFNSVRLYQGKLLTSVLLTLLFGLLHWMPLRTQARKLRST